MNQYGSTNFGSTSKKNACSRINMNQVRGNLDILQEGPVVSVKLLYFATFI